MGLMYAVGVCLCLRSRLVVFFICSVKLKNITWSYFTVVLLCKVGVKYVLPSDKSYLTLTV